MFAVERESSNVAETIDDEDEVFLDDVIQTLMTSPFSESRQPGAAPDVAVKIPADTVVKIAKMAERSLITSPALLRIPASDLPIIVIGDLHGQFRDLRIILSRCGDPAEQNYIFLGDFVDRGTQVYLLRGNHEDVNTSSTYGFYDECVFKYKELGELVWLCCIRAFNCLPLSALLGEKVLCMHGGLSPHIENLDDINKIVRPTIVPPYGLLCDLVWSDPESNKSVTGWSVSSRGISFVFDDTVADDFCKRHDIDVIIRAHQITTDMFRGGYKLSRNGRVVTMFSAPNYLNMRNDGAVLKVDSDLQLRFIVFRPGKSSVVEKFTKKKTKYLI